MTTSLALLDIGPFEFVLLAAAAVLLFGGDLPDAARKAARFLGKLRSLSSDLSQELQRTPHDLRPPSELQRPPELDRPPELGLDAADKDLFGKASPTTTPVDADWRPTSHEPFPGDGVTPAPAKLDQPAADNKPGPAGGTSAHDGAPAAASPSAPASPDKQPGPATPSEPDVSAEPDALVDRREDQPPA